MHLVCWLAVYTTASFNMQTSTSDGETILLEGVKGKRRVSKDDGGEKKDENGKKKEGSVMGSYFVSTTAPLSGHRRLTASESSHTTTRRAGS